MKLLARFTRETAELMRALVRGVVDAEDESSVNESDPGLSSGGGV